MWGDSVVGAGPPKMDGPCGKVKSLERPLSTPPGYHFACRGEMPNRDGIWRSWPAHWRPLELRSLIQPEAQANFRGSLKASFRATIGYRASEARVPDTGSSPWASPHIVPVISAASARTGFG